MAKDIFQGHGEEAAEQSAAGGKYEKLIQEGSNRYKLITCHNNNSIWKLKFIWLFN